MGNNAIGASLGIPQSVLNKLDEVDKKINLISSDSEKMVTHFTSAMTRMDRSIDPVLTKIIQLQSNIANIDLNRLSSGLNQSTSGVANLAQGFDNTAIKAEKAAESIVHVTNELAKVQSPRLGKSGQNIAELTNSIGAINKELLDEESKLNAIEQQSLVNRREGYKEELKQQQESTQQKIDALNKELKQKEEIVAKAKEANLKALTEELTNYEKKIASQRRTDEKYQQDYLSWLNKKKEAETKSDNDNYQKEYEKTISNEQKKLEAVAKAENAKREERRKTIQDGIDAANRLQKAEEQALKKRAKLDSRLRSSNYSSYISSYEGSLRTAEKASDINSRTQAIRNLEAARAKLKTTDADYVNKLSILNSKILELNKANARAIEGSKELRKQHNSLMDTAKKLAVRLGILYGMHQIQGFINSMIEVRANMELQQRSLEAILQNKTKADALYQQIVDLAVRSPFTIQELTSYTKQLAAYRIESEKLYDTTKMLADISAGLGVDMQRLILAYGQVKAANYLRGQELRQFSEAGINILGELADYFGELNNKVYTSADVFDMVSKRMVKFEDVAAVFKRMTSEGGIFFNMQEIQAETLRGQLSNLRDSLDMMFNEMGKAKDGAMKDAVSIVRTLIENWQVVADVLTMVVLPSFGLYAAALVSVTIKEYASIAADEAKILSLTGIRKATYSTITSLKALQAAIISNPVTAAITAAITAATALGVAIYEINKRTNEARAVYDDLNKSIYDNLDGINASMNAIQDKNRVIAASNQLLKSSTAGEDEKRKATEAANKAEADKARLIEEFKTKYPEYYDQIKDQIKTTDGVAEAQERLNKQMEVSNYLMFVAKNQEGPFKDGFVKTLENTEKSFANVRKAVTDFGAELGNVRNTARELAVKGIISDRTKEQIDNIITSTMTLEQKGRELHKIFYEDSLRTGMGTTLRNVWSDARNYLAAYGDQMKESKEEEEKLAKNSAELAKYFFGQYGIYSKEAFEGASEEQKKNMQNDAVNFLSNWKTASEDAKKIISNAFAKFGLNIPISFSFGGAKNEIDFLGRQVNDYVTKKLGTVKAKALGISFVETGTGNEYLQANITQTKALREELKQTQNAASQLNKDISNKDRIKELKEEINAREDITKQFGLAEEEINKRQVKGRKTQEEIAKARISLIKKANDEYKKLIQYYDKEKAHTKVVEALGSAFKENGLSIKAFGFDYKGTIEHLTSLAKGASSKTRKIIYSEIGDLKTEYEIKIKKESLEKAKKDFDKLFSDYDFAITLDEGGIDKNLFSDILNNLGVSVGNIDLDDTSLIDIFKKAEEKIKILRDTNTEESVKIADEEQKKLEERKIKYAQDTAKKYLEYTKRSISERLNIEMEADKKIAQARKDQSITGLSDEQVNAVVNKIQKEKQKALDALSWKDFKESDLYIKMFEDLEHVSTAALGAIKSKLNDMRKNLSTLDPTQVKEIATSMEKIDEQLIKRNPFKSLVRGLKDYISLTKKKKEIETGWIDSTAEEESIRKKYETQERIVVQQRDAYSLAKRKYGADSDQAKKAKEILKSSEELLDNELKRLVAQKKITQEFADQIRNQEKAEKETSMSLDKISEYLSEFSSGITDVASNLENVFGMMSDGTKNLLDNISEIAGGLSQMGQGISRAIANPADVGGYIQAVSGLTKTLGSVFAIGDKKKEREIQRQIKLVGNLQEAYEKLEEAIDKAYSIDKIKESTDLAKANIMSQISAYDKMIRLEEDKKKTDKKKIEEYKKTQDELREQLEELDKKQIESLGGIVDNVRSTARGFVDAWYDAFTETGNGLSGLEDKFNDMFINIIKEQAALRIADKFMAPLFANIDKSLEDYKVTTEEAEALKEQAADILPQVSDALEQIFGSFNALSSKSSELSGLQKGIQGVTEETAQALESLLNSTRFFVADSNKLLHDIYNIIMGNDNNANPILGELRLQTAQLTATNKLLNSVVGNNAASGTKGIRVYIQ